MPRCLRVSTGGQDEYNLPTLLLFPEVGWRIVFAIDKRGLCAKIVASLCIVLGCTASFGHGTDVPPKQIMQWHCAGNGWGVLGCCGSFVYAASVNPTMLQVWQWDGNAVKLRFERAADNVLAFGILPHERWISQGVGDQHAYDCVGDIKTGKETNRWRTNINGFTTIGRGSGNGKFLAGWHTNESVVGSESTRFGLVGVDGKAFQNVVTLAWDYDGNGLPAHIDAVPSNDGKYIGVCIPKSGIATIDAANKKVLWTASYFHMSGMTGATSKRKVPWKMVALDCPVDDVAFASDSKLMYVVGRVDSATGGVWGLNSRTGEVVTRWHVPLKHVHDLTSMSVSLDGRFVAVGTEPRGLVLLFSTKNGQCRTLNHGGSSVHIASFSPDSKRLATFGAGQIKIWRLPGGHNGDRSKRKGED